jgi:D-glycero-beta-D-manno-heptose 1-phosphate adenylyltransferase
MMKALPALLTREEAATLSADWRARDKVVVFTNGCFDLLHPGHVRYLAQARALGDLLLVGLNDDDSVRRLKGPPRPLLPLAGRAEVLMALRAVDAVVPFSEPTPLELIRAIVPHVLVKGGDWAVERIVGREVVEAAGGRVLSIPLVPGISTSEIVRRIQSSPR